MSSFYSTVPTITAADAKVNFSAVITVTGGQTRVVGGKECIMYDTNVQSQENPADGAGPKKYNIRCFASNQKLDDKWPNDTLISTPGFLAFKKDNRKLALYIDSQEALVVGSDKSKALDPARIGVLTCHFLGRITARLVVEGDEGLSTATCWEVQLSRSSSLEKVKIHIFLAGHGTSLRPTLDAFPEGTTGTFTAKFIRVGSSKSDAEIPKFEAASMHGIVSRGSSTASTNPSQGGGVVKKRKAYDEPGASTATTSHGQPPAKKTQLVSGPVASSTSPKVNATKPSNNNPPKHAKGSPESFATKLDSAINTVPMAQVATRELAADAADLEAERLNSEEE